MPVFSCGGMRYQYQWQDVPPEEIPAQNQANLEATIRRSLALGINHIETARGYGTSELQLGRVLSNIPRQNYLLQTKVSPNADGQVFRKTVEQSLRNLQVDYVDLLGLHGINNAETYRHALDRGGSLEVARQLQAEGKIRFIGFSTHGPTQLILDAIETDAFDYVNLHWYYINQGNWPAIEAAVRHDMGIFIISPSDKGGQLYNPPPKLVDLCAPLSPMVFNDLFCLSHPQIHTLSLGAARPSDFDEHLKALPLLDNAQETLRPILRRLEAAAIEALGQDWYETWDQGLPSHEDTPAGINIPVILWLRNLAIAFDLENYARMRYNLLGQASHWFPGNRADLLHQVNLQACLRRSPHADKIPDLLADAHSRLGGPVVQRLSQQ